MALISEWTLGDDPLSLNPTDEAATVEPGLYGIVASFDRKGQRIVHRDYIGDPGYTVRFGDGTFGRLPNEGDLFRLIWRSGPGRASNLPADTIVQLEPPAGAPPPLQPLPAEVLGVRNPFALTNGRDLQSLELARRIAPAAFKSLTFRAVRNEDYRKQAERLEWVSTAGAVTRWTGAWATTFVSADPKGAFEISPERMAELRARMGAVRQVGRPVIVRQPVFVPLDLRIAICVTPGYAFGNVAKRIIRALEPTAGGYFHPDHFTFGQPLRRADLEAAIARVEGVRAVLGLAVRQRGLTSFVPFETTQITAADNRILKVENDPDRSGQGSIRVYLEKLPDMEAAA
jgi:predicted phage baseplate assembly protein